MPQLVIREHQLGMGIGEERETLGLTVHGPHDSPWPPTPQQTLPRFRQMQLRYTAGDIQGWMGVSFLWESESRIGNAKTQHNYQDNRSPHRSTRDGCRARREAPHSRRGILKRHHPTSHRCPSMSGTWKARGYATDSNQCEDKQVQMNVGSV